MAEPLTAPLQPDFGEFQTVEWDADLETWWVRDLTDDEIAEKFPRPITAEVVLTPEEQAVVDKENRIKDLRFNLIQTDYVALSDYDKDKPDILAQRAEWRAELRQLEG